MKSLVATVFLVLMFQNATLNAQGVYMTPGDKGPLFSDKPQPGAKEIILPPLNVVAPPQEPRAAPPAPATISSGGTAPVATVPEYRSFFVVSPENDGSVLANTALFEVRVAIDPPLQLGERHAFAVSINGRPVGQRFTANEFMIPPEFWGDTLPPVNQGMQLDVSVVDGNGQVVKKAAPVRFFMRHLTILNRPRRPLAAPVVAPKTPVPRVKTEPEPAGVSTLKRSDK